MLAAPSTLLQAVAVFPIRHQASLREYVSVLLRFDRGSELSKLNDVVRNRLLYCALPE